MRISIEKKLNHPFYQAILVFLAALLLIIGNWLLNLMAPSTIDRLFPWSVATAFMLFFALMNSLLSLRADSFAKYWQASMYSYMVLALGTGLIAWGFSGIPIGEAGSYKWIYLVVSFGFLVFLSLINFVKIIVKFAEREEWNQPRRK